MFSFPFQPIFGQSELWGTTVYGGINNNGVIFHADSDSVTVAYDFPFAFRGSSPSFTQLVDGKKGLLYGETTSGGTNGMGVIFSLDTLTNAYVDIFDFNGSAGSNPYGSLFLANNGLLYGMTSSGGANNAGVIFSLDPVSKAYLKLFDFGTTNGSNPEGAFIQAKNGKLYGLTFSGGLSNRGILFSFDISNGTFNKLFDFPTGNPNGSLVEATNGKLYGMTTHGGINDDGYIFSFDPSSLIFNNFFDFDVSISGAHPFGALLQATDGKLYGMTQFGGSVANGVLFSIDLLGNFTNLYEFNPASNGTLPEGSLIQASNGLLYGLAFGGGANNNGVLFSFNPSSKGYSKLFDFNGITGDGPRGTLMYASNNKLYGMASAGGLSGNGVVFSYIPSSDQYKKLIDFNINALGASSKGSLFKATNGLLYGMTQNGGVNNFGVLYSFDYFKNSYKKILDFDGSTNGSHPTGTLVQTTNGTLYGMTVDGGINNNGIIFSLDTSTGTFKNIFVFNALSGSAPKGSLLLATNGLLYGITSSGGIYGGGTLFSFDPSSNTFNKQFDFGSVNGINPIGSLIQADNGLLYGITRTSSSGTGVLFSFNITNKTFTKLLNISSPSGSPLQATNGLLYGMTTYGGKNGVGILFSFDPKTNLFTKIKDFDGGLLGGSPNGGLFQACNGKIYGTTSQGGKGGQGLIFEYNPITSAFLPKQSFTGTNGNDPSYATLIETVNPQTASITSISSNLPTICSGNLVKFTAKVTNGGNSQAYQWTLNGKNVVTDSAFYSSSNLKNGDTIMCQLTTTFSCPAVTIINSSKLVVTVKDTTPIIFNISPNANFCKSPLTLVASPLGGMFSGKGVINNQIYLKSWEQLITTKITYTYIAPNSRATA
jgi:uncharacterized repeat protein (TIGR03803 family)